MGYEGRMCGHGFRTLASTWLHENKRDLNLDSSHIEIQLSHIYGSVSERSYNYAQYLPERRHLMQAWSDYVCGFLKGGGGV